MNRTRLALLLFSSAWLGVAGPQGFAAQLMPLGPEVDLLGITFPNVPRVAAQPDGAYVVAWDEGADSHANEIYFQYVAAGSTPEEGGWSSVVYPDDRTPSLDAVAATPGGFDLLWHGDGSLDERLGFYRQHLDLRGEPDGTPILLGRAGTQWLWHVRGNGFMAGWALPRKRGIAARRLASSGQRTGPELRLNSRPIDRPEPVVLGVADGGFLAVWRGVVPGPTATAVLRARRFSPAGKPLGHDFDVPTIPLGVPGTFRIAAAPGGGFAVAWASGATIYLRFFDVAGIAQGPEFPVATADDALPESLAFDNAGNLLLLWSAYLDDYDLRLQLFDSHGAPLVGPVGVRSEASEGYEAAWGGSVAWAGSSWLVTWMALGVPAYDFGTIFVRRFAVKQ